MNAQTEFDRSRPVLMGVHLALTLFPTPTQADIESMALDISKYGMRNPVVIYKNLILDGRCRYAACVRAGLYPKTVNWSGEAYLPTFYVLQTKRESMKAWKKSARAIVITKAVGILEREVVQDKDLIAPAMNLGKTLRVAVFDYADIGQYMLRSMCSLMANSPDLFARVECGDLRWNQAYEMHLSKHADKVKSYTQTTAEAQLIKILSEISGASRVIADCDVSKFDNKEVVKTWIKSVQESVRNLGKFKGRIEDRYDNIE